MAHPAPGAYDPYAQAPRPTNAMAIASLVCALLFAPLGIVFGHVALSQIKRTGEDGRGLALAGLIISYALTLVAVLVVAIAVILGVLMVHYSDNRMDEYNADGLHGTDHHADGPIIISPPPVDGLPPFDPPPGLGSNCSYPATGEPPSKPNTPPRSGPVPTQPPLVGASVTTNFGPVDLSLDNGKSPCTVNSFVSLAQQGYFDDTRCHRLTTGSLAVLQCGDPTGTGAGGPGYQFEDEYPVNQHSPGTAPERIIYPRGTLAMANAGPGTNGSQFFVVYQDSPLPPAYTVFGQIDGAEGLAAIDRIAHEGVADGGNDGEPAATVTIESIRLK